MRSFAITFFLLVLVVRSAAQSPAPASALEGRLRRTVQHLSETIGERNLGDPRRLKMAADWIRSEWRSQSLDPRDHSYRVGPHECANIEVDVAGPAGAPIILVGAHYDSVSGTPGADDNATGVAVLLEISRALAGASVPAQIRCVAFTNEEPPHFKTELMGSAVYAKMAKARSDPIEQMISIECVGYFRDARGTQKYPPALSALYPDTGNFIGVVGNTDNVREVARIASRLAVHSGLPVERANLPATLPGVDWSDHASFWAAGYPGLMITDTAPYRNPNYHRATDTAETIDHARLTRVAQGLINVVRELARR